MMFIPRIINEIAVDKASAMNGHMQGALLVLMGAPGCMLSLLLIPRMGMKYMGTVGFFVQVFALTFFAGTLNDSVHDGQLSSKNTKVYQTWVKFGALSLVSFSLSFGPAVSTFIMPAISFPAEVRSTFHGISAMAGKLGAIAGTFIFVPMETALGLSSVVVLMAISSLLGAWASHALLLDQATDDLKSLSRTMNGAKESSFLRD